MIRTVLAVAAGYAVVAALVIASGIAVEVLGGSGRTIALVNLLIAVPCGAIGGYIAAYLARGRATAATIALTALAMAMGVLSLLLGRGRQPLWYWCGLLLLLPAGAYYGGLRRNQQTEAAEAPKLKE